jgi:hypothetical protein
MVGAGDRDFAGLDRLTQAVQSLGLEFGKLIEKQDALMGERNLARAPPARSPAIEWISDTSSSSRGVNGGKIDGSRAKSMDLPARGGPLKRRLWPPAAAISRARLALS